MTGKELALSFEFFPPRTDAGRERLLTATAPALAALEPEYFSVTYGAGGSTRDTTASTVSALRSAGLEVAPHLSFGNDGRETIARMLDRYRDSGISRIVALRGDLPSGGGGSRQAFASELVRFIRSHSGDHFHIEVAAYPEIHPEAPDYDGDIRYLRGKFEAGANAAITQYFYSADCYFRFLEECRSAGIDQPIVPGIMPITNYRNLARFSERCGAEIPRWMRRRLEAYGDDADSVRSFGLDVVTRLCEQLVAGGAPGLHIYTMNQLDPTRTLCERLRA